MHTDIVTENGSFMQACLNLSSRFMRLGWPEAAMHAHNVSRAYHYASREQDRERTYSQCGSGAV